MPRCPPTGWGIEFQRRARRRSARRPRGSGQGKAATAEGRYRVAIGSVPRTVTNTRTHDHCFPFNFWRRREAAQKLEPLPPGAESWGTSRAGCGPPADARGQRGREGPVPPRRGTAEPARTAEGGTRHRPTGRRGRKLRWDPGNGGAETLGARPWGVAWTHQVPRLLRAHGSGGSWAKRAEGGRSGGLATARAARRRREPGAAEGSGRGARAGGGAMGRGGAKPAASVTRARASLSQGCPTTCRGTSQRGAVAAGPGPGGRGDATRTTQGRRPEALPRARTGSGRARVRAAGGRREPRLRPRGTGSGRGGAGPAEACSRGARPCELVAVSPAADQRFGVRGARSWERTAMGPG